MPFWVVGCPTAGRGFGEASTSIGPFAPAAGSGGNVSNRDYESVVLDRMRRAQEKAKLIAAMEAEDAATDGRAENAD